MLFKYPNILYFLFLLLIPIIIHLVRWKRYRKVEFTNVAFLQELEIKSRKSRKLKELLILLMRLLALTFLILAFAQPFKESLALQQNITQTQNIIYLDNSKSMSILKNNVTIWQTYLQKITQLPQKQEYTILTNDQIFTDIAGSELKKLLYNIKFSHQSTNHQKIFTKLKLLLSLDTHTRKNIIYVSDLQNVFNEKIQDSLFDTNTNYYFLNENYQEIPNISIDSIWLVKTEPNFYTLSLQLSASVQQLQTPLSIIQNNEVLWHSQVNFKDSLVQKISFQLPIKNIKAKVVVNDQAFLFDNELFFCLQPITKPKILVISEKNIPNFLKKIYTDDEFVLKHISPKHLDYNKLSDYQLVILYGFKKDFQISEAFLKKYVSQYGNLVVIPAERQTESLQNLLRNWQINVGVKTDTNKVWLNHINYQHPFFKGIFTKKVKNFTYPFVKNHYVYTSQAGNSLYLLSDGSAFASLVRQNGNIFLINTPLSDKNTNFLHAASLVVPLFYQMAFYKNQPQQIYYVLGEENSFTIEASIPKDDIVKIKNDQAEYIPRQINLNKKIEIYTQNIPEKAGIYNIVHNDKVLSSIAFNDNRMENKLNFIRLPDLKNLQKINDLQEFITTENQFTRKKQLWKWFLSLALMFLLIEMLIIKFWK